MNSLKETPHIIGYVDMLGIKDSLQGMADNPIERLNDIYETIKRSIDMLRNDEKFNYINIKYKCFSDNIVFAVEVSDNENITFESAAMLKIMGLFQFGILTNYHITLRGAICTGGLYINDTFTLGTGLEKAYFLESKIAIYPRIIVERNIAKLFSEENNSQDMPHLITGDDDYAFVNYLCFADKESIIHHYDFIEETYNKMDEKGNIKVMQKFSWLKRYHNNYCKVSRIGKLFEDIYDDRFLFNKS